jgi:hypothetical protein
MRWLRCFLVLLALAAPAAGQQADVLTGRVIGADGQPLVGARVEAVSAETEITRSVITDGNGRYMILFPDGGGRYLLRVTFIGMADAVQAVVREGSEELLLTNITMRPQAIALDAISVAAQRPPPGDARAGEQSTELSQDMLNRLPLPDLDPNTVALLAAGVVGTGLDSISGQAGFSVAGMSELLNQVTLDGVVLGGRAGRAGRGHAAHVCHHEHLRRVPRRLRRRHGLHADCARQQPAGGSFSYRLDSDALQSTASATTNAFSRHQFSGSYGGPIIANKLFYNGSLQFSRNTNHRFALSFNDPLAGLRSGVAPDSIGRFLDVLNTSYGFNAYGQVGAYDQVTDDIRLQGRVDWNIVQDRNRSQTLSVRFNTNLNDQDSTRISQLDLMQRGGEVERNNLLAAATLTSRFRTNWTNTLSTSFSESWNQSLPFVEMPEGRVRITSDFDDGTRQTSQLVFGGNRSMPQEAYTKDLQLSNDLSLLQPIRNQIHRFKLGGSAQYTRNINRSTDNLFGTFTYASLEDFQDNRPERYERSLSERQTRTGALTTGLYIGDTWRVSQPLETNPRPALGPHRAGPEAGIQPARRTALQSAHGHGPRRVGVQPARRLQLPAEPAGPAGTLAERRRRPVRRTRTDEHLLGGGPADRSGRCRTAPHLHRRRRAVPRLERVRRQPGRRPELCADGGTGSNPLSSRAPNVTIISPDQSLPSSLRADIGYRAQLPLQMNGNFRYTYSRGMGLWGYRDLNINEQNRFTLAARRPAVLRRRNGHRRAHRRDVAGVVPPARRVRQRLRGGDGSRVGGTPVDRHGERLAAHPHDVQCELHALLRPRPGLVGRRLRRDELCRAHRRQSERSGVGDVVERSSSYDEPDAVVPPHAVDGSVGHGAAVVRRPVHAAGQP